MGTAGECRPGVLVYDTHRAQLVVGLYVHFGSMVAFVGGCIAI